MKQGDTVRSKKLVRLAGAVRSKMEEYRRFKGVATIIEISRSPKGDNAIILLESGKLMSVKLSSVEPIL